MIPPPKKHDFKKQLKHLYGPSAKTVMQVDVPKMNFLMIDGKGDPNTEPAYSQAVQTLFSVAYGVKFMVKRGAIADLDALDYGVMPLEGLWWADDMASFEANTRSDWKWTMMIMQPDFVDANLVGAAVEQVRKKKPPSNPSVNPLALDLLWFESFAEGACAQVLHVGPFTDEGPTIERVHAFIAQQGQLSGKYHEIYLSDVRRGAPANWKTIIRQPFECAN